MLAKLLARLCAPPVASCIRREELCLAFAALSKLYPTLPPQHKPLEPCKTTNNLQEEPISISTTSSSSSSSSSSTPLPNIKTTTTTSVNVSNTDGGNKIEAMPSTVSSFSLVERVRHLLPVCSSREISLIATGLAALSLATPPIMDILIRHLYVLCDNERHVFVSNDNNKKESKVHDTNCNLATLTTMINVALSTGHVYSCTLSHLILENSLTIVKSSTQESRSTIFRFINAAANYLENEKDINAVIESFAESTKMSAKTLREAVTCGNEKKSKYIPLCGINTELASRQVFAQLLTECKEEIEHTKDDVNNEKSESLSITYYSRVLRMMEMYISHNFDDPCALSILESLCVNVFSRPVMRTLQEKEEEEKQLKEEEKRLELVELQLDKETSTNSTTQENTDVIHVRRQLWEMVNKHSSVFHRLRHTLLQRSTNHKVNTESNELNSDESKGLPHLQYETLTEEEVAGSSTINTMQPMQLIHRAYEDMCHGVHVQDSTLAAIRSEYREYDSVEAMTKAAALFAELGKVPDGLVYKLYGHLHELTLRGVSALLRAVRRDITCSLTTAVEEMLREHIHAELISQSKLADIVELLDVLAMPLPRAFSLPEVIISGEAHLRSLLLSHILNIAPQMHLPSLVYLNTHACVIEDKTHNSNDLDVLLTLTCNKLCAYMSNNKSSLRANNTITGEEEEEEEQLSPTSSSSSPSSPLLIANRKEDNMSYVMLASLFMLAKRDRVHDELLDHIVTIVTARVKMIEDKYCASSSAEKIVKVNEQEEEVLEKFLLLVSSLQIRLDAWQLHEPMEHLLHLVETHLQNKKTETVPLEKQISTSLLLATGLLAAQCKRVVSVHRIQSELECNARVESMTQLELKFTITLLSKCESPHPSLIQQVLHKIWRNTQIHAQLNCVPADQPSTFVKHAELNEFTTRQNYNSKIWSNNNSNGMCTEEEFKRIVQEELCVLNAADVGSLLATCTRCFVLENVTNAIFTQEKDSSNETGFDHVKKSSFNLSREDTEILHEIQTYLQSRLRACQVQTYITLCVQSYRCEHFLTLPFTDSLLTYFPRALDYLTSSQISEALFAFGEMSNAGQRLSHEVATAGSVDYVVDNVDLFWSGPEIAKLLHGFAKLHCTKRSLYSVFAQHLTRRAILFTLDRPSISLLFHAFSLVKYVDKSLVDRLTFICSWHAPELNPADLLLIVKSHSRMMLWSPSFYRVMGAQITARADEFPVLALCELFAAFGNIQLQDNNLAEHLLESIAERVSEIPEANTAVGVLVSMWQMNAGILNNDNANKIADYIVSHAEQLNSTSLLKLCTVMNDISWSNRSLVEAMADQSVKLKLMEQITPEAGRAVLDVLSQNMMHHEAARNELSKLARGVTKETVLLSDNEVQELQALIAR